MTKTGMFSRTCNILHNSYILYNLNYEFWTAYFYSEYFFFLTVASFFSLCTPKTESDPKIFHQTDGSTSYQILLDCALAIGSNQEFKVIYLGTRVPRPWVQNHESPSCIKSLESLLKVHWHGVSVINWVTTVNCWQNLS